MAGGNLSPRQKMINMMYLVLTAMLALNVSSEVLNGFTIVNSALLKTIASQAANNDGQLDLLKFYHDQNPVKVAPFYEKALRVKQKSDSLVMYIDQLKIKVVHIAEGPKGDPDHIEKKDNTDAISQLFLTAGEGGRLREAIYSYQSYILSIVADSISKSYVRGNLNTDPRPGDGKSGNSGAVLTWEQSMFGEVPLVAGVTILNMIKENVLSAQNRAYSALMNEIDQGDFRVNTIKAYMIPASTNVIRGGKFVGQIVLSAEDSTKRPNYFIGGTVLSDSKKGLFERDCPQVGEFDLNGRIELLRGDGTISSYPFSQSYNVVEPTATVSATLMNLLYSRYDNPVSISVPGIPSNKVVATVSNGIIRKNGENWIIVPGDGAQTSIVVSATIEGKQQVISKVDFRLRKLPDPEPYVVVGDEKIKNSISRKDLMSASDLGAGIYDGFLNVPYKVLAFSLREFQGGGLYKDIPSNGSSFSNEQKNYMRTLSRGASFVVRDLKVEGPYGVQVLNKGYEISIE